MNKPVAPFGTCPFCNQPLGWESDEPWIEDECVTVRYLHCQFCGAEVEACECPTEERENYEFYNPKK